MLTVQRILLQDVDNNVVIYVEIHRGQPRYDVFRDNLSVGVTNFDVEDNALEIGQRIGKLAYPEGFSPTTLALLADTVATFLDNGHDAMCETNPG